MKSFEIRKLDRSEYGELKRFLYDAIFVPAGEQPPSRDIVELPELRVYTDCFGEGRADFCFVADADGKLIGAAWSRIMNDYGHVDDETPSIALSVQSKFRRRGIATALMTALMNKLRAEHFRRVSLSVQKANDIALKLYDKCGFKILRETDSELLMVADLLDISD